VRVLKAAQKAKFPTASVHIKQNGDIEIIPGTPEPVPKSEANPWDE
jgi:hypothetical protein